MLWRIIIWAGMALGCGWFLETLFEPIDPLYTWILYLLPFILFGFLYQRRIRQSYSWVSTRPFFSTEASYKRLTFWGIPIRSEEEIEEEIARTGEGILPVILTAPKHRDKTRISVQKAFRTLSRRDISRIKSQLSSSRGATFLGRTVKATQKGRKFVATMMVVLGSQLRSTTKVLLFGLLCAMGVWFFLPNKGQIHEIAGNVQLKLQKSGDTIIFLDAVNDLYIPLEKIPAHFRHALVLREDRRFYSHWGWDWRGKFRAAYQTGRYLINRFRGRRQGGVQGGSTLTQQLARNLFLSEESHLIRKFREMILAFKLEWYYTKDEILEMYLNKVFFGPGRSSYGVEVASRTYFNKSAEELNLYESALLIQAVPSPYWFSFQRDEQLARKRAKNFLETLANQGKLRLGKEEVEFTKQQVVRAINRGVEYGQRTLKKRETRYLLDWIRPQIENSSYFEHLEGDFTIVTTLNSEMQIYAEEAVKQILTDQVRRDRRVSEVALVALAPDGAVRALLGGRDYGRSQFRRATLAKRQPGSTFKMFVYLAALEQGWKRERLIADSPVTIENKAITNFDDKFLGEISLIRALALSRNAATIQLIQHPEIGVQKVIQVARRLGITSDLAESPGLALGISEVTLLELTGAYSVLANSGFALEPYGIIGARTKRGNVRYWHQPLQAKLFQRIRLARPVVKSSDVTDINTMLQAVVAEPDGTGRGARFEGHEIAGKTGTTDEYRDAWFVGFSAHLCTGVWVGNDDNSPMRRVSGSTLPADIFREFMTQVHEYLHLDPQPLP